MAKHWRKMLVGDRKMDQRILINGRWVRVEIVKRDWRKLLKHAPMFLKE